MVIALWFGLSFGKIRGVQGQFRCGSVDGPVKTSKPLIYMAFSV